MRPRSGLRFLGSALTGWLCGCSGSLLPPPQKDLRPPAVDPGASYPSPARWDYHPPAPLTPLAAFKHPDGGCVFTAEGGQRWRSVAIDPSTHRLICSGPASASLTVATEDLTSGVRRADGSWLFVGESGALYESADALGPFTRTVPAPEPLAKGGGTGAGVLAATLEGKLLRWEPGSGWRPVPPSPALAGARVFDLTASGAGRVLALGFPEALFTSEDFGVTWSAAAAPLVGARRLGSTAAGELGAQGLFSSVVWRGGAFVEGSDRLLPPTAALTVEVGRAAAAVSVQAFRAVLEGERYYEVVRPDNEGDPWVLARGRLEGRLSVVPLADTGRCANVRLGARGAVVFIACVMADGSDIAVDMRRSDDAGSTWGDPLRLVTPDTDQIIITISPQATALVAGVCKPGDGGPCRPSSPMLLRASSDGGPPRSPGAAPAKAAGEDGGTAHPRADGGSASTGLVLRPFPVSAPQLNGPALHPIFSADGRSAYFLGKRGKDDRTSLFVSHDGGETFSPRALQAVALPRPPRRNEGEDELQDTEAPETFELDESTPPHPGDDGVVGLMALRSRGGFAYLTTDEDGRVLHLASPPLDDEGNPLDVILAGSGRRVLALPSYLGGDGSGGSFWESLDGGANWDKQVIPQALVREYARANIALVCGAAGCLMGDTVARVGWGSAGEPSGPERPPDPVIEPTRATLAPLVCELGSGTRWSRVDNLFAGEGAGPSSPGCTL